MALPPLQDILNLLPDNTQGLIEPADLRQEATVFYESISDNQSAIANRLPLTGGTLTGSLYLANDPAQLNEAATKNYVDNYALGTGFIQKIGDEMTGDLVLLPTPAGVNSAITKGYADSVSETYFNSIADTVIFTDGRNTMNANYTPSLPQSVATRQYVDDNSDINPNNLVKNPIADQVIEGGYGIRVSDDYTPSEPLDLATKKFTETRGDLFADGSVDMDAGYTPSQPQSIATKDYIDSLEISGGQAWSEPTDGDAIEAGKGFYSVNAGDTFTVSDTDEDISFIVTDGSNSASADNPVILEIDSALGYTFADGTTTFEIDLAGASVEFALINGVWELVNTGNIIFGGGAGANVVTLLDKPVGVLGGNGNGNTEFTLSGYNWEDFDEFYVETRLTDANSDTFSIPEAMTLRLSALTDIPSNLGAEIRTYDQSTTSANQGYIRMRFENAVDPTTSAGTVRVTSNPSPHPNWALWLTKIVGKKYTKVTEILPDETVKTLFTGAATQNQTITFAESITGYAEIYVEGYWTNGSGKSWINSITLPVSSFLSLPTNAYFQLGGYTENTKIAIIGFNNTTENGFVVRGFGADFGDTVTITKVVGKKRTTLNQELTETANTWIEPQTFNALIKNADNRISHNVAAFTLDFATGNVVSGGLPFQGTSKAWSIELLGSGTTSTYLAVISAGLPKQLVASLEYVTAIDPCKTIQIDSNQNIVPYDGNGNRIGNNTTSAQVSVIAVF